MTDRELLELAAKAAGVEGRRYVENKAIQGEYRTGLWCDLFENVWNPLTDDGDALRLAVALGLDVRVNLYIRETHIYSFVDFICEHHKNDQQTATRRAIVRAAAEIGKAMP